MLTISGDRRLAFLTDNQWWRHAWRAARVFAPCCVFPAAGFTVANLIAVACTAYTDAEMHKLQSTAINDLSVLFIMFGICLVLMLLSLVLSLWALSAWLVRLTAFARLFTDLPTGQDITAAQITEALNSIRQRRAYLLKVWLGATLYLLVPVLPLCFLIALHSLTASANPLLSAEYVPIPPWLMTTQWRVFLLGAAMLLSVMSFAYSFTVIVFSAVSDMPAFETACVALRESVKHAVPLLSLAAIVLLANIVLTAPQMIIELFGSRAAAQNPYVEACAQVWLGICSSVVWPLSVAPFCRLSSLVFVQKTPKKEMT